MVSKQFVLNHCKEYFLGRIERHNGRTASGWGHPGDDGTMETRCALGSLVKGRTLYITEAVREVLGMKEGYHFWPKDHMYKRITTFNDKHCGGNFPLTPALVDDFLVRLAIENDLNYLPIEENTIPVLANTPSAVLDFDIECD